jgi:hypothetical protein
MYVPKETLELDGSQILTLSGNFPMFPNIA